MEPLKEKKAFFTLVWIGGGSKLWDKAIARQVDIQFQRIGEILNICSHVVEHKKKPETNNQTDVHIYIYIRRNHEIMREIPEILAVECRSAKDG